MIIAPFLRGLDVRRLREIKYFDICTSAGKPNPLRHKKNTPDAAFLGAYPIRGGGINDEKNRRHTRGQLGGDQQTKLFDV